MWTTHPPIFERRGVSGSVCLEFCWTFLLILVNSLIFWWFFNNIDQHCFYLINKFRIWRTKIEFNIFLNWMNFFWKWMKLFWIYKYIFGSMKKNLDSMNFFWKCNNIFKNCLWFSKKKKIWFVIIFLRIFKKIYRFENRKTEKKRKTEEKRKGKKNVLVL